jgi:hypothetical protein
MHSPKWFLSSGKERTSMNYQHWIIVSILRRAYGVADRHAEAVRKLRGLKQKNREFTAYYAEFERYMADCDYSDQGKIDWLLFGLNRELLNALSTQPTTSWNWARPSGTSVRLEPPTTLGAPYQHPELLLPTCLGLRTPRRSDGP